MMAEAADKSHVFISDFMRTKSVAEQDVLAASKEGFSTVALRVDTLYGPNVSTRRRCEACDVATARNLSPLCC
jgi:hypothetical protein